MDLYPEVVQVLTIGPVPPLEAFADAAKSPELARLANDEMAELVAKYRTRFVAAIALLPMNDVEASLKEAERAIKELGFRGIYMHTNINGKPLDSPEYFPLFEMMSRYNLPVYLHPWRGTEMTDYPAEKESKYLISSIFGWPYETTAAMTHLVFGRVLERLPNLKIITHHAGGMVPYYEQRILQHYGQQADKAAYLKNLTKPPLDYYRMFYNDTAIHGNTPALMLAYHFWGADHIVFGADMPLGDHYRGFRSYRQTLNAIQAMEISDKEKAQILSENALNLLKLSV